MTPEQKQTATSPQAAPEGQGPLSKAFGLIGFLVGMALMIAYVPLFKDHTMNFIVGGLIGGASSVIGAWLGALLERK